MSSEKAQALMTEVGEYLRTRNFADASGLLDVEVTTGFDDASVIVALDPRTRLCPPCQADWLMGYRTEGCRRCAEFQEGLQAHIASLLSLLGRVLGERFTVVGGHPGDESALAYHVVQ